MNRGTQPAVYLEISNREEDEDTCYYSDPEVDLVWNDPRARGRYARRDGAAL